MSPYPVDDPGARGPMRLVVTAVDSPAVARQLADGAVARRLAACAQVSSVRSTYWWRGTQEAADERVVVFKTDGKRVGALFRWLAAAHPYEVPEIIELDVPRVHAPYFAWLQDSLGSPRESPGSGTGARRREARRARGARAPGRTRAPRPRR